jgi:hypothetical protein
MRHNKFIGWERFLGVVEQIEKYSPWLSRQIAKRASEWPFWYSGLSIKEWNERQVWVHLPTSFRNSVDGEISQGHLVLGAELALRLVFLRLRQEFPFRYRLTGVTTETPGTVDQSVDFKFGLSFEEWEKLRLSLAREQRSSDEFAVQAQLADGRLAGSFTFQVAFEIERLLPGQT